MSVVKRFHRLQIRAFVILLLSVLAASVFALPPPNTLQWNSNTESDLAGYKVYRASMPCTSNPSFVMLKDVGKVTTFTDTAPPSSACYTVSAYDTSGNESGFSNLVGKSGHLAPSAPSSFGLH